MGTIIGNIAPGASPSQEDFRVFETQSALNTYLSSARAKAGQTVKLKDTATGKYKAYVIQGASGSFTTTAMSGSYVFADSLPSVSNADADTDYYIGEAVSGDDSVIASTLPAVTDGDTTKEYYIGTAGTGYLHYRFVDGAFILVGGYTHYRFVNGSFVAVGGDTSGIESAIDEINVALAGKGVALVLDGTTLTLVDSNRTQLGDAITLPPTGISSLYMQTVNAQVEGETKTFLEILESSTSSGSVPNSV